MLNERSLINGLIWIGSLILAPYMLTGTLRGDWTAIQLCAGIYFVLFAFFVIGDRLCAFPLFGGYLVGKLNGLPLEFTAGQVFTMIMVVYFLLAYFVLRQRRITFGDTRVSWPLLVILGIILYHLRTFGLHVLGSDSYGSRPTVMMLLAIFAYFCGINIPSPSAKFLSRLPAICVTLSLLSQSPNILSTYIPSLAPYLYVVTDNVNIDAYIEANGGGVDIARMGALGGVGLTIYTYLVARFSIFTWWRPERWLVALLAAGCFVMVAMGGYRALMFGMVLNTFAAAWCYGGWRVFPLTIAIFAVILIFFGVLSQNKSVKIPITIQRTLSFLPIKWDDSVELSAQGSNSFRDTIQKVYLQEYAARSPLLGNGFTFDPKKSQLAETDSRTDPNSESTIKIFIETKNYHIGWIGLYDTVGIIGSTAFLAFAFGLILSAYRLVQSEPPQRTPVFYLKVWLFINVFSTLISFFVVFGDLTSMIPGYCAIGIILYHLHRVERRQQTDLRHLATYLAPDLHRPQRAPVGASHG